MLNRKFKIILITMIISLSVANADRLDYPFTDRLCYGSELAPGYPVFLCFIDGTEIMEASFLDHPVMNDYYTPQLKEVELTGGSTGTFTAKAGNKQLVYGTLTVTGSPSYLYTKWVNK